MSDAPAICPMVPVSLRNSLHRIVSAFLEAVTKSQVMLDVMMMVAGFSASVIQAMTDLPSEGEHSAFQAAVASCLTAAISNMHSRAKVLASIHKPVMALRVCLCKLCACGPVDGTHCQACGGSCTSSGSSALSGHPRARTTSTQGFAWSCIVKLKNSSGVCEALRIRSSKIKMHLVPWLPHVVERGCMVRVFRKFRTSYILRAAWKHRQ